MCVVFLSRNSTKHEKHKNKEKKNESLGRNDMKNDMKTYLFAKRSMYLHPSMEKTSSQGGDSLPRTASVPPVVQSHRQEPPWATQTMKPSRIPAGNSNLLLHHSSSRSKREFAVVLHLDTSQPYQRRQRTNRIDNKNACMDA